jgi:hypothetical protein
MIKFDTSDIDKLIQKLDNVDSKRESLESIISNTIYIEAGLLTLLKTNIGKEVYGTNTSNPDSVASDPKGSPSPNKMYHRTGDLMRAAKIKKVKGKVVLYIDSDFLKNKPQAKLSVGEQYKDNLTWLNDRGRETVSFGEAVNAHNGESYELRVEEGFTYLNPTSTHSEKPRPFMKATFDDLPKQLEKVNKDKLLDRIVRVIFGV